MASKYMTLRPTRWLDEASSGNYIITVTEKEREMLLRHIEEVFHGSFVRQEIPSCTCGKVFTEKDLLDAPSVYFRKVNVFGKTFTLIEPICPVCKRRVETTYNILN